MIDILQLPDSPVPSPLGDEVDYFMLPPLEGTAPGPGRAAGYSGPRR